MEFTTVVLSDDLLGTPMRAARGVAFIPKVTHLLAVNFGEMP